MKRFFIQSFVLTVIVSIVGAIAYSTLLKPYFNVVLPFVVLFFFLITNFFHAYLLKIAVKSGTKFISKYMAVSFLKMFFYILIAIGFVLMNRDFAKIFLVNYLLLYLVYTTFEVIQFSRVVKQKNL
jgi:hypothetical protein